MHDSDSDSADDDADFQRFVDVAEPADSDSREAWAASSSEVRNSSSIEENFSPQPSSNWSHRNPQSGTTG